MSKRRVVAFLALSLVVSGINAAPSEPATAAAILKKVVELAREEALNAPRVDWPATTDTATKILQQDPSEAGLTAAVRYVLSKLQDRHSFYKPPASQSSGSAVPRLTFPIAKASVSPGGMPVLTMGPWSGREVKEATVAIRKELVSAMEGGSCGIIVDFSSNSGGNMWPMVMGALPLYTDGILGAFEGRDQKKSTIVSTGDGLLYNGAPHFLNQVNLAPLQLRPANIAVVIGPRTASSGEITALFFKGQTNAKFFGEKSAGVPTANRTFKLENDALLGLTTAVTLDRNGNVYDSPLVPDVETRDPIGAADDWIKSRCSKSTGGLSALAGK